MIEVVLLIGLLGSVGVAAYLYKDIKQLKAKAGQLKSQKPLSELEAIEKASEIAKNKILEAEETASKLRMQLKEQERILDERENKLLSRGKSLDSRFDDLDKKEKALESERSKIKELNDQLSTQLEKIAQLTKDEAVALLKKQAEVELTDWMARKIKESEQQIQLDVDEKSKEILVETMLNSAVDYVAETTTTTIEIPDESLKSRIIGKSGRNVRTFEKLTGVDIIIDESPTEVTISCFDPIRREVAAIALNKLVKTGKINPASIEETIDKVKKELLKEIRKTGEMMAYEAGFTDLPNELIMLLGRFKYRFSYGQNLVKHTLEMVKIGETLAKELGADVKISKMACLFHDLGKVAPEEGKQHHHISAEIVGKYYKDERLINAIDAHHFDVEAKFIEAEIVRIADAISGSRPGARVDSYEDYIKRIRALEDIAIKHSGVKQAFAIQAGREVRVIVEPDQVSDEDTKVMAYKIAKEIEETQTYPGVIKVNVIREYRIIEEAK